MIQFKNVSKKYGKNSAALSHVNLHIRPKEFVSIIGRSGAGKSTLAKLLIAQERPSAGEVIVGGWDISKIRNDEIPFLRRQIGVVFQDFNLLANKTVEENVSFALEVAGMKRENIRQVVTPILKIVGLEGKEGRYPDEVSGGEMQRVAIARALAHRPKIFIADEPTG
ncbi:MAG: ATP-binding cassette domain-containing protein, partial [Parcubacteria group bacterium]|nr:ATP-binding cassette domain-containing protein [Parcubacteria group bacterium]